jgi:hypothetical protein
VGRVFTANRADHHPDAPPMNEQLVIELHGNKVVLILNYASHYAAIEVYEKLLATAREGFVLLDVEVQEREAPR